MQGRACILCTRGDSEVSQRSLRSSATSLPRENTRAFLKDDSL